MDNYHVLVIGPRLALLDALRSRNIRFSVWRDKAAFPIDDAVSIITEPLWNTTDKLKQITNKSFGSENFTHVIAGIEAAVYPAAVARRVLGARLSLVTTALRCRDKLAMKEYLSGHGIPMTDFMAEASVHSAAEAFERLGSPLVRKQRKSSGGRGLQLIEQGQELVLRKDGRNILERYVSAPEASIESFISGGKIRFANITRYLEKGHVNFVPSAFDDDLQESIKDINRRVVEALKISWGMTHLEVYLSENGLLFGEIALRPPGGYIMNAIQHAYGFNPWQAIVAMELDEPFEFPAAAAAYSCVQVYHPGEGRVTAVQGEGVVRNHPATREFRLKVRPGDSIRQRLSAGQDTGYLLHTSESAETRLELHRYFQTHFSIQVERE